jgi:hypothetical protein
MTTEPTPQDPAATPAQAAASTPAPSAAPPAPEPVAAPAPAAVAQIRVPMALQKGERALKLVRRHWMWLWPMTLFFAGVAIVPIIIAWWVLGLIGDVRDDVGGWFGIPAALWFLFWLVRAFLNWYRYDNDLWVVTNQRIIDSFKAHPFSHTLSTADLVNITDMTVVKKGIFETMLNYGDVVCQTAGSSAKAEFRMIGVPTPSELQLFIDAERDRERLGKVRDDD